MERVFKKWRITKFIPTFSEWWAAAYLCVSFWLTILLNKISVSSISSAEKLGEAIGKAFAPFLIAFLLAVLANLYAKNTKIFLTLWFVIMICFTFAESHDYRQSKTAERLDSIEFSPWQFYSGETSPGAPFCSMLSGVTNKNIGQNIVIKVLLKGGGDSSVVVSLYKDKWNRVQGSSEKVMFDFADNKPLTLNAYADGHILDVQLSTQVLLPFLRTLASAPILQVIFPDEDEETWAVNTDGAKEALKQLTSCAVNFRDNLNRHP